MTSAPSEQNPIFETIKTVVYALLIAGLFRTLLFQPFWIPSASMKDTLLIGDFLFVNKMAYGYSKHSCPFALCPIEGRIFASDPERGDVVVFTHPVSGETYIKRLIGLPGDRVQVKDGVVHLNGEVVPQEPAGEFREPNLPQGGAQRLPSCARRDAATNECVWDRYTETLPGGRTHDVLNITNSGNLDNTGVFTVPEGQFFFMGDNRDDSTDSRVPQVPYGGVGFVPFENLIGRADRVIFSSAGERILYFWTWRKDRFFHAIN